MGRKTREKMTGQTEKERVVESSVPIPPSDATLKLLTDLKVVTVEGGKYVYAPEFKATVEGMKINPPRRLKQMYLAKKCQGEVLPNLLTSPRAFKNKRAIENLIVAYVCFKVHLERLGIPEPKDMPNLTYGVWYLNDHELLVGDVK